VRLAVVVQRYGPGISGGAELHARYVAEHLARHAEVEVMTTCATDYVTWRNELAPGTEVVNGVPVHRFPVSRERDPITFGRLSERVFDRRHTLADELSWLDSEGPQSPALITHVSEHAADHDFWIFFSFRYYHAYHGVRAIPGRAVLVPTAERDPAVGLSMFQPIFRGVRALMYNSPEERAMIHAVSGNDEVPSVVVGIGSAVPADARPARFRQQFNVPGPFAIYVGRIDENKGCNELFEFFDAYLQAGVGQLSLVLVGSPHLPIPSHPRIRHVGFLDDRDKFDAMAASELLIMPSYFESLSMVALEAWGLGRPVLANAKCDVLKGQCIRSGAGLYYDNALEFVETLCAIEQNRWLSDSLGRGGRRFFREHYDWPVIERKYLDMLERLSKEPAPDRIEALPGWIGRRKSQCPPSKEVVANLPAGPVIASRRTVVDQRARTAESASAAAEARTGATALRSTLHPPQPGRRDSRPQGGAA
jgi:glycosyltransferase involved in cell wall biosynthesis